MNTSFQLAIEQSKWQVSQSECPLKVMTLLKLSFDWVPLSFSVPRNFTYVYPYLSYFSYIPHSHITCFFLCSLCWSYCAQHSWYVLNTIKSLEVVFIWSWGLVSGRLNLPCHNGKKRSDHKRRDICVCKKYIAPYKM